MNYGDFFAALTSLGQPHEWQRDLAAAETCGNRLIRIPTGFGKTFGVIAAWLFVRVHRHEDRWPRRLVWCLPMRVLAEQTVSEVECALARLNLLWDGRSNHEGRVGVHLLMGGANSGEWHLHPEHCAVLIGTQDMLLSRAMNRGYAAPRARWPMEFGLLNHDCLWVMDEVQLMDVGFATSAQLQSFRLEDERKQLRPSHTWWMSATLQPRWLETSPDTPALIAGLAPLVTIPPASRKGRLWDDVRKPCVVTPAKSTKELASVICSAHVEAGLGAQGPTLIVLNRVERAIEVFEALNRLKELKGSEIRLVHSRFRPQERKTWRSEFLNKEACGPGTDRIIVATQVVEAGVDLSAVLLVTELAPWTNLVQRFGRCARWGGSAQVIVADFALEGDKAKPYTEAQLDASRDALGLLPNGVAPRELEAFEEAHPELLHRLYPYEPAQLLLRHELDELFDTTPDLSGADIDVSRFIRSDEERDLHVFWAEIPEKRGPNSSLKASRDALCAVPFLKARDWLCGTETASSKAPRLKKGVRAWVWDWQDGIWRTAERRDLYPGQTVLVAAECGGYDYDPEARVGKGWDAHHQGRVPEVLAAAAPMSSRQCWRMNADGNWIVSQKEVRAYPADEVADAAQDSEELSVAERWKTVATHGLETGREVRRIAGILVPKLADLLDLAGRWHDAGKAHPAFQSSIQHGTERPDRQDIAKAPDAAWPCSTKQLYAISATDSRPGFRHELASVLALFGVLQRHSLDHSALLGPWRELMSKARLPLATAHEQRGDASEPTAIEKEVLSLDADGFNLLAYLVCAHHGKLRLAWHAGKGDQTANDGVLRIRGVRQWDILPPLALANRLGSYDELPTTRLELAPAAAGLSPLTGQSWTDRVLGLLTQHGPFALAWLESLLRAADQRASRLELADPLLAADNSRHELDSSDSTLARAAARGAHAAPSASDSPARSTLDGDGRGASGRALHPGTTRPPYSATRYVETRLGILSYQQLAPHLAERMAMTEVAIGQRQFASNPLDEFLILELHRRICGDLVPAVAGRWRTREVQVGDHEAPAAWRVPMLMRDYGADLAARVAHASGSPDDRLIESLTFAEGQLLYIHPFEDFNGRVTRLFLVELLYRLDLPIVDPATDEGDETERYFAALRAYDRRDSSALAHFWRERFEKEARP